MTKVLIVAGDPSGDILAAQLAQSMKKLIPNIRVVGVGGHQLEKTCDQFLMNIVTQHALGFYISPRKILFFHHILSRIITPVLESTKFDAVIPVDFYGFNSQVAKTAKRHGNKIFYYASPQFWASRPRRADKMKNIVDLFLCLFPFETDFYQKRGLPAKFVGHPLLDNLPQINHTAQKEKIEKIIGLLPGSRPDEIKRHLPIMMDACQRIKTEFPNTRFILFTVPNYNKSAYESLLLKATSSNLVIEMVEDTDFLWRSQLDMALTASGMETLENALLGIPMVVLYKTSWFNYWVVKSVINIPFIGMPNLLAGKEIVPERIQGKATPREISEPIIQWLKNPDRQKAVRNELLALRQKFGEKGASERAARTILEKVA